MTIDLHQISGYAIVLSCLSTGIPSAATAAECKLAIGWSHESQIVRSPDCESIAVSRLPGQSELTYSQSRRYDLRFQIDSQAPNEEIVGWLGKFCAQLKSDDATFLRRRSSNSRKDTVFFRCRQSEL